MKGMYRIAIFALLGTAAFAQTDAPPSEKPPAEVDKALRARVNDFYTLMKNHEYRKGEALIAEDTREYYYAGSKPDVHTFEILDIEYSDRFTHARAITRCTQPLVVAGFPPSEINVKLPSLWRFENGNWYLYEEPSRMDSPGGLQKKIEAAVEAGTAAATADAAAAAGNGKPADSGMPKELPKNAGFAMGKIEVDRTAIALAPGTSEQIHISNHSPGPMMLELGYPLKGVEPKLDRTDLNQGDNATLTLKANKEPFGGIFYLRIMPTEEVITIRVQIKQ